MGWLGSIAEFLKELLQAIPAVVKYFSDSSFKNEQQALKDADEEQKKNNEAKDGRPSGDFWKGDRP